MSQVYVNRTNPAPIINSSSDWLMSGISSDSYSAINLPKATQTELVERVFCKMNIFEIRSFVECMSAKLFNQILDSGLDVKTYVTLLLNMCINHSLMIRNKNLPNIFYPVTVSNTILD